MADNEPAEEPVAAPAADQVAESVERQAGQVEDRPDLIAELGLDESLRGQNEADIIRHLHSERQAAEEEWHKKHSETGLAAVRYARESLLTSPEMQEFQKWKQERESSKEPEKKWFERPDFDPSILDDYRDKDSETGAIGPVNRKALAEAGLLEKALAYSEWQKQHDGRWEKDREGYLLDFLKYAAPKVMSPMIEEAKDKWEEQRDWGEWDKTNGDWIYVTDESGRRMQDPHTGQWALTQEGLLFHQIYSQVKADGVANTRRAREIATQMMLAHFSNQQMAQTAAPAAAGQANSQANGTAKKPIVKAAGGAGASAASKAEQQRKQVLKVAGHAASRGGSFATAERPDGERQNRKPKIEDEAEEHFRQLMGLKDGA